MKRAAALALAAFGLSAGAQAHPFHASHAEVDFRPECGCLEVALAVVPEELEAALERISGKRIPLEAPEAEGEILDYLKTRFVVVPLAPVTPPGPPGPADTEPLPIQWVGREVSYREAWLYFKVTGVKGDFDLADRVLFEAEGAQVNHVLLRGIGDPKTLAFRAGEGAVRVTLP